MLLITELEERQMKARILIVAIMCLCTTVDGYGRTVTVDANGSADYTTIQAAIDDANNDDIVQVWPGTYQQTINFLGKNITVTGLDPEDPCVIADTVIDANGLGSAVTFDHSETNEAVLTGFTITGGTGTFAFEAGGIEVYWGAGICCEGSSPTIVRNVIVGNHGPVEMVDDTPVVVSFGGSIVAMAGEPTITRNIIKDNSAYFGAAVAVISGDAKIVSNLIYENYAWFGAGAAPIFGGQILANTIVENSAQLGGGVCLLSDDVVGTGLVSGNIIYDNTDGGGMYADFNSLNFVSYNDVNKNSPDDYVDTPDLTGLEGNISADPCFINAAVRDFTLHAASPCIDTGDPNYVPEPNETDLDGRPRVIYGRIDMGAYEFNYRPVADAGPNQVVYADHTGLAEVILDGSASYDDDGQDLTYKWSWTIDGNSFTSTGGDGIINLFDFAAFAEQHSQSENWFAGLSILAEAWLSTHASPNWDRQCDIAPAGAVITIELPVGEYIIKLVVNDGIEESEPDYCTIEVIAPLQAGLFCIPRSLNRKAWYPKSVLALISMPPGIRKADIDLTEPLIFYPGQVESQRQFAFEFGRRRHRRTYVWAWFDKSECIEQLEPGFNRINVVGKLTSGRYYDAASYLRLVPPKWWWYHWPHFCHGRK